ncbi:MAG: primosomal protein N', partial [Erysipelotrichaceae bacterium]
SLSDDQNRVISELIKQEYYQVNLLHGITGSGKSEIYLHLAKYWLNKGKQVLILVPEIGLTPQMINLFVSRLNEKVAIYHSKLSKQERHYQYLRVKNKKAHVVVGTRSAIFLPFDNLGTIIIDEEHDDSYKQNKMPRYHTRDIAIYRSKYHNCSCLLASATPSLESYARALKGVYKLLEISTRVNGKLPHVELVDMAQEARTTGKQIISSQLEKAITKTLANHQQVMILLNRRGYTPISKCLSCQAVIQCDNCDVAMVYHKNTKVLKCHTCGMIKKLPKVCPQCGDNNFIPLGIGTQKLEEELQNLFPNSKILRMDRDTTIKKNSHQELYSEFANQEADILVGTQMISKGLDFPQVALVGILNADYLLNRLDYRAQETTFSLLTQAAGRAGRASFGASVIIQAYQIDHYALQDTKNHDYKQFFVQEMKFRKLAGYPPYQFLILVTLSGKKLEKIMATMIKVKEALINKKIYVLGVSQLLRRNNIESVRISLKGKDLDLLRDTLKEVLADYPQDIFSIDINPQHTEA